MRHRAQHSQHVRRHRRLGLASKLARSCRWRGRSRRRSRRRKRRSRSPQPSALLFQVCSSGASQPSPESPPGPPRCRVIRYRNTAITKQQNCEGIQITRPLSSVSIEEGGEGARSSTVQSRVTGHQQEGPRRGLLGFGVNTEIAF